MSGRKKQPYNGRNIGMGSYGRYVSAEGAFSLVVVIGLCKELERELIQTRRRASFYCWVLSIGWNVVREAFIGEGYRGDHAGS